MRGTKITHWIERKPQRKTYTNTKKRIEKVKKKINRFRALNAQRAHTRQLLLYRCVCKLLKSFKNIWIEWTPSTEQILIVQRVGEGERERKKNPFKQSQHCELKLNNNILLTRNPSSPAWCFFPSSFPSLNRRSNSSVCLHSVSHFLLLHLAIGILDSFLLCMISSSLKFFNINTNTHILELNVCARVRMSANTCRVRTHIECVFMYQRKCFYSVPVQCFAFYLIRFGVAFVLTPILHFFRAKFFFVNTNERTKKIVNSKHRQCMRFWTKIMEKEIVK